MLAAHYKEYVQRHQEGHVDEVFVDKSVLYVNLLEYFAEIIHLLFDLNLSIIGLIFII